MEVLKSIVLGQELCTAASRGDELIVKSLIELGAPVDGPYFLEGAQPYLSRGQEKIGLLFEDDPFEIEGFHGDVLQNFKLAAVNSINGPEDSCIPFFCALSSGSKECVNLLSEAGVEFHVRSRDFQSALFFAKDLEMIQFLVSKGLDLEEKDRHGFTPLLKAIYWGEIPQVQAFIKAGANVNVSYNGGETAFLLACRSIDRSVELLKVLSKAGVDCHALTQNGCNAFHEALDVDYCEDQKHLVKPVLEFLKEMDVDLELRNHRGQSPLAKAIILGTGLEAQILCQLGANPNVITPQYNFGPDNEALPEEPLVFACFQPVLDTSLKLKTLIEVGVNLNVVDHEGLTPLEVANNELKELLTEEPRHLFKESIEEMEQCISLLKVEGL